MNTPANRAHILSKLAGSMGVSDEDATADGGVLDTTTGSVLAAAGSVLAAAGSVLAAAGSVLAASESVLAAAGSVLAKCDGVMSVAVMVDCTSVGSTVAEATAVSELPVITSMMETMLPVVEPGAPYIVSMRDPITKGTDIVMALDTVRRPMPPGNRKYITSYNTTISVHFSYQSVCSRISYRY